MTDGKHRINFVGAADGVTGETLGKIKEDFEETVSIGFEDEFDLKIDLEWDIDEEVCYISHEVFSMWEEEPEELLAWIKGFFLKAVEDMAEDLSDEGEKKEAARLRRFYLTLGDWDDYYGREDDEYDDTEVNYPEEEYPDEEEEDDYD